MPLSTCGSAPPFTRSGVVRALIDAHARVCRYEAIVPSEASVPAIACAVPGRYGSLRMSSSRVHTTLTGAPIALDTSTASVTKSISPRRPKPPPQNIGFTVTDVERQAGDAGRLALGARRRLRRQPHRRAVGANVGGGVHRLHRRVREVRRLVVRAHDVPGRQGAGGVARILQHDAARLHQRACVSV